MTIHLPNDPHKSLLPADSSRLACRARCLRRRDRPDADADADLQGSPRRRAPRASGYLPEHTLEAYTKAIDLGADVIEPDLISTKDGALIARHDPALDSDHVASRPSPRSRERTMKVDGIDTTGFFAVDSRSRRSRRLER